MSDRLGRRLPGKSKISIGTPPVLHLTVKTSIRSPDAGVTFPHHLAFMTQRWRRDQDLIKIPVLAFFWAFIQVFRQERKGVASLCLYLGTVSIPVLVGLEDGEMISGERRNYLLVMLDSIRLWGCKVVSRGCVKSINLRLLMPGGW